MASSTVLFSFLLILFSSHVLGSTPNSSLFPSAAQPTKSGYLPVAGPGAKSSSALFFAFYEAQQPLSPLPQTPLLIWLQGGPGCSSMLGNFFELGPWLISAESPKLRPNSASWNRRFGLLFIDNPVGTGFSIAASADDIPRNQTIVAANLWVALKSFLSSDSAFQRRPLYITGESYAGKYVPSFAYYILQKNPHLPKSQRINFRGVAIGNGLTHPVTQVGTHAASAFFTGLINEKQKAHLEHLQREAIRLTLEEKWLQATDGRDRVLNSLHNMTGLATLYDLSKKRPYESGMVGIFLNKDEVKAVLGVDKAAVWEECSSDVGNALQEDVMKSVKFMVEELLRKSKVLLYQGIYDLRDGVVSTEAWMKELQWEELESFLEAERKVWKLDGELVGYVQRWKSLSHVVISGAGHLVPADQGVSSQAMIEDWVLERGLFISEGKKPSSFRRSY